MTTHIAIDDALINEARTWDILKRKKMPLLPHYANLLIAVNNRKLFNCLGR